MIVALKNASWTVFVFITLSIVAACAGDDTVYSNPAMVSVSQEGAPPSDLQNGDAPGTGDDDDVNDDGTSGENPNGSPTPTPSPTSDAPIPSNTPSPSNSPAPSNSPNPSNSPVPSNSPNPSNSPVPSNSPNPSNSPAPSSSPNPSNSPRPSVSPRPSNSPRPSPTPSVCPTPSPTPRPHPSHSPKPSPTPRPTQTPVPQDPGVNACDVNPPTIALLEMRKKSFKLLGRGGTMTVDEDMHVNSKDKQAVTILGKGTTLEVDELRVGGSIMVGPRAQLKVGSLQRNVASIEDPMKGLEAPNCAAMPIRSNKRIRLKGSVTLEPGRYLGGIYLRNGADVVMKPGIYCLIGGGLRVHRAKLSGEGVMIYNTSQHRCHLKGINFSRKAWVHLSPIADCTNRYAGITLFQDSNRERDIRLASGHLTINGMIYAPKSRVTVRVPKGGNTHPFSKLIANKLRVGLHLSEAEVDMEGDLPDESDE